jgi:hypothetical protein
MKNNPNAEKSSKIQRVLIGLNDYSFYHGPSEIEDSDERFIGREKEIDKLKSVLTDTSKKSGAYLVTGYRGMGKTSFVNKVLEEIYSPSKAIKYTLYLIRMLFISFLCSICLFYTIRQISPKILDRLDLNFKEPILSFLIVVVLVFAVIFLLNWFSTKTNRFLLSLITTTPLFRTYYTRYLIYCLFIFIISILTLTYAYKLPDPILVLQDLIAFYLILIGLVSLMVSLIILRGKIQKKKENKTKNGISSNKKNGFRHRFTNFSDHINIKLNLGYSNLTEIDILKLIARNIKTGYKKHTTSINFSFCFRLILFLGGFFLANVIYKRDVFNAFRENLRRNTGLITLFPSQQPIFLHDEESSSLLQKIVSEQKKHGKFHTAEYRMYVSMLNDYYLNRIGGNNSKFPYSKNIRGSMENQLLEISYYKENLFNFLLIKTKDTLSINRFNLYFTARKKLYFDFRTFIAGALFPLGSEYHNAFEKSSLRSIHPKNISIEDSVKSCILTYLQNTKFDLIRKKFKSSGNENFTVSDFNNLTIFWKEFPNAFIDITEDKITINFLQDLIKVHELLQKDFTSFAGFKNKVISIANYIDYALYQAYFIVMKVTKNIPSLFLPKNIDYFYFVFLFIFLFVIGKASVLINNKTPSRRKIMKKINLLNDIIDSNLSIENNEGFSFPNPQYFFSQRKSKAFAKDDVREIEKSLIEIIEDIGNLPMYSYKAQFIFVFDELDKIDPSPNTSQNNGTVQETDAKRIRQQAVMELLSNLKYFLSTAQAKFIFIAGRELYDAFLADISDRNFRIGSIFHDVIYINSFLTDLHPLGVEDITSRTEEYVCKFLFPPNYPVEHSTPNNLHNYNKYLKKEYPEFNENCFTESFAKIIARQKREKIIHLLQQFIIYLNHVSKGAPSKLTAYFENFIMSHDMALGFVATGLIVQEKSKMFLFFDYYRQYHIGVVNYLLTPINFSINKNIRNYSDKLIVSASFLNDHLFKFHRNAFAWRDLESTPEMVDVNKNPELRDFLSSLIHFMLDSHIQPIVNGLYDFKFPKQVAQEIAFLSHISQEASATFNFTLDESRISKQHFYEQYTKLSQNYNSSNSLGENYIYSLASSMLTLADICYYDEDLGQAISYYLESIQKIRDISYKLIPLTQLILLTRNMLKLGHTLEKRKTYDVAYNTYHHISIKVIRCLQYNKEEKPELLLDNIRFFYQPMLSRFYLTEKSSFSGISKSDIDDVNEEFKELLGLIHFKNEHIKSEFYNKIGDILFYKNRSFSSESKISCPFELYKIVEKQKCCACEACFYYRKGLNQLLEKYGYSFKNIKNLIAELTGKDNSRIISSNELVSMAMMVSDLGDTMLTCLEKSSIDTIDDLPYIGNKDNSSNEKDKTKIINKANPVETILIYYRMAAFLYRRAGDHRSYAFQYMKYLYIFKLSLTLDIKIIKTIKDENHIIHKIARASLNGMYSAYEHIHSYEINRFKHIFNDNTNRLLPLDTSLNRISLNAEIDELSVLVKEIELLMDPTCDEKLESIDSIVNPYNLVTNMNTRFLRLRLKALANQFKFTNLLGLDSNKFKATLSFNQITKIYKKIVKPSFLVDIDQFEFLITDSIFCNFEMLKILNTFGNSFSINHSLMAETHEKLLIWSQLLGVYLMLRDFYNNQMPQDSKSNLVSRFEDFYEKGSEKGIEKICKTMIISKLEKLIERDNLPFIMPFYQCEKALNEYWASYECHSQGRAYKQLIENMYYLNDDFNDKLYHFTIALERFKNSDGYIFSKIAELKGIIEEIRVYSITNYFITRSATNS